MTNTLDNGLPGVSCEQCPLGAKPNSCNWYRQTPVDIPHPWKEGEVITKGTWDCAMNWQQLTQIELCRQIVQLNGNLATVALRMEQQQLSSQQTQEKLLQVFQSILMMAQKPAVPNDTPQVMQPQPETPKIGAEEDHF